MLMLEGINTIRAVRAVCVTRTRRIWRNDDVVGLPICIPRVRDRDGVDTGAATDPTERD